MEKGDECFNSPKVKKVFVLVNNRVGLNFNGLCFLLLKFSLTALLSKENTLDLCPFQAIKTSLFPLGLSIMILVTSFATVHRLYKGSQCTGCAKVNYYVHFAFEVINKPH